MSDAPSLGCRVKVRISHLGEEHQRAPDSEAEGIQTEQKQYSVILRSQRTTQHAEAVGEVTELQDTNDSQNAQHTHKILLADSDLQG